MNRFQYYQNNILSRDFILKTHCKNIMEVPILSKIVLNTSIKNSSRASLIREADKKRGTNTGELSRENFSIINDKNRNISSLIALEIISGQKLKKTRSKKFIAGFKLRKGELIACKVTLRGERMSSFFEKLVMIVFPKLRDFQGLSVNKVDNTSKNSIHRALRLDENNSVLQSPIIGQHKTIGNQKNLQHNSFDNHGNISFGIQNLLLFPELESHYELFESLKGFQVTLVTNARNNKEALLLLSGHQIPF